MRVDESSIWELVEHSQDLNSDQMRATREALAEVVEVGQERRSRKEDPEVDLERRAVLRRSLLGLAAGTGLGAVIASRAWKAAADTATDVAMLQTSAAIENLAVAVYQKAASLPPQTSGAAIPAVKAFVVAATSHHQQHAQAFNAAVMQLGGQQQTQPDKAVYDAVVVPALGKIMGPADVVSLALTLEDAAAQTYTKFGGDAADANAIKTWASIAPVETQHVAILLAVQAILALGQPQLIQIPVPLDKLPGQAGGVGMPNAFEPTTNARPADEGKVG